MVTEWPELLENVCQSASLCRGEKHRMYYISIPVILFGPFSQIIHSRKLGKRMVYERAVSQMETDLTAGKNWEKAWRFLLMDFNKDRCKGLQVRQQSKAHRYSWRSANDPGSWAEQKWLVLRGCKDSKELPRSTHRNRIFQPVFFSVWEGGLIINIFYLNRTKEHGLNKPVPSSEEKSSKRNIHS